MGLLRGARVTKGASFVFAQAEIVLINSRLESINFYLLHLTLMREYLDLEFHEIEPVLPFDYSLERVIDDFVLLAVFVGNDFLPNLPDLHIHENGLEKLFDVYKKALPGLGTYPPLVAPDIADVRALTDRGLRQRKRYNPCEAAAGHPR